MRAERTPSGMPVITENRNEPSASSRVAGIRSMTTSSEGFRLAYRFAEIAGDSVAKPDDVLLPEGFIESKFDTPSVPFLLRALFA